MFVMRKDVLPENYFKVQVHILNERAQPLRGLKRRPWYLCGLPIWWRLFSSGARGGGQCWGQPCVALEGLPGCPRLWRLESWSSHSQGRAQHPGGAGGSGAQPMGSLQRFPTKDTGIFVGILCVFWIPM